ncbi:MAG: hypothetical protein ACKVS9_04985 [Phycisphaerae bacterium]
MRRSSIFNPAWMVLASVLVLVAPATARQAAGNAWKQPRQVEALTAALGGDGPSVESLITLSRLLAHPIDQLQWLVVHAQEAKQSGKSENVTALTGAFAQRLTELTAEAARVPALKAQLAKSEVDALSSIVTELTKPPPPPPPPIAENPWGGGDGDPQKAQYESAFGSLAVVFGGNLNEQLRLLAAPAASGDQLAMIDRMIRGLVRHRLQVDPLPADTADAWRAAHDSLTQAKLPGWAAMAKVLEALAAGDDVRRKQSAGEAAAWVQSRLAAAENGPDAGFLKEPLNKLLDELRGDAVRTFATAEFYAGRKARLADLEAAVRSAASDAQAATADADRRTKVGKLWEAIQRLKDSRAAILDEKWQPLSIDIATEQDAVKNRVVLVSESDQSVFVELVGISNPRTGMSFGFIGVLVSVKAADRTDGPPLQHAIAIGETEDAVLKSLFDATIRYQDGTGKANGLILKQVLGVAIGLDRFPGDAVAATGGVRAIWREADFSASAAFYVVPSASVVARKCLKGATPKIWTERSMRLAWLNAAGDVRGLIGGRPVSDALLFKQKIPAVALHGSENQARSLRANAVELQTAMKRGDGTVVVLLDAAE